MSEAAPEASTVSAIPIHTPIPMIPMFEGRDVDAARVKVNGTTPTADLEGLLVSVDDVVRLVGDYKVTGVRHYVDPATGNLIREQIVKPLRVDLTPWDPSDPNDDGVLRAR